MARIRTWALTGEESHILVVQSIIFSFNAILDEILTIQWTKQLTKSDVGAIVSSFKSSAFLGPNFNAVPGLVAQWITRLTTDQKIPGSNPGKLESPILRVT